ncbi:MAG: DUF1634 domain-containing protein [Acidobacteriia bacterium]|nr:DUF1634 domain-containing protein [Terriglobia bacterium]
MSPSPHHPTEREAFRLEVAIGIVLRAGVMLSSACLALGLVLSFSSGTASAAGLLLNVGIVALLATPVARVFVSIVEYVKERDWRFTTLTLIVLVELLASVVAALIFERKI